MFDWYFLFFTIFLAISHFNSFLLMGIRQVVKENWDSGKKESRYSFIIDLFQRYIKGMAFSTWIQVKCFRFGSCSIKKKKKKNIGAKQNKKRNRTRSVENESEQQERNQNWVSFIIIGRAAEKTAIILNQLASHYAYRLVIVNLDTFYMPAYKCISILAWYLFNRKKINKDNGEWRRWKKKEFKK